MAGPRLGSVSPVEKRGLPKPLIILTDTFPNQTQRLAYTGTIHRLSQTKT